MEAFIGRRSGTANRQTLPSKNLAQVLMNNSVFQAMKNLRCMTLARMFGISRSSGHGRALCHTLSKVLPGMLANADALFRACLGMANRMHIAADQKKQIVSSEFQEEFVNTFLPLMLHNE